MYMYLARVDAATFLSKLYRDVDNNIQTFKN